MSNFQKIAEDPVEAVKNIIGVGQKIYENNEPTGSTYADRFLINSLITGGLGAATGAITAGLDDEENEEVRRRKMISNTILGGLLGGTVGAGYSAATKLHTQDSAKDKVEKAIKDNQPKPNLQDVAANVSGNLVEDHPAVLPLTGAVAGVPAGLKMTNWLQKGLLIDPTQVEASKALLVKLPAGTFDLRNALHANALEEVMSLRSGLSPREIQKVLSAITSTAPHDAPGAIPGQRGVIPSSLGQAGQGQQEFALTKFIRGLFNSNSRNAQDFDLSKSHVVGTPLAKPLSFSEKMFGPGPISERLPTIPYFDPHTGRWILIPGGPRIPHPDVRLNAAAFAEMNYVPWINRLEGALRSAKTQRVAGAGAGAGTGLGLGFGLNYLFNNAAEKARLKYENNVPLTNR